MQSLFRFVRLALLAGAITVFLSTARAADCKPTDSASKPPALKPADDPMVQQIDFNATALDDVVDFLNDVTKGQARLTVARVPGASRSEPLVTLKARNVTVGQILQFITLASPQVLVQKVDGENPLTVLNVTAGPEEANRSVRVYRLALVLRSMSGKADEKKAMDDLLSLLKAALEQAGGEPPVLKVHEETQSLLFSGSPSQHALLQGTLETLMEKDVFEKQLEQAHQEVQRAQDAIKREEDKCSLLGHDMEMQKAQFRLQLADYEKQRLSDAVQIEQLRVRLELLDRQLDQSQQKPVSK